MSTKSSSSRKIVRGAFAEKSSNPLLNPGRPSKEHDSDDPHSLLADGVDNKVEVVGQPQPRIKAKHTSVRPPAPPVKEGMSVPQSGSGSTDSSYWWSPEQCPAPSVPERAAVFGAHALQTCWRPNALQTIWRPSLSACAAAAPSGAPPPNWAGQWASKGTWKGQQNW